MNNLSSNYLVQLFQRAVSKSPKFFQIIQIISAATALVTGLPGILSSMGIQLTGIFLTVENKTIAIAAVVALIISRLPITAPSSTETISTPKANDDSGGSTSVGGTNPPPGGLPGHP